MREILFRGKQIDNSEWAYGVPLIGKTSGVFMVWMQGESKGTRGGISIRDVVKQSEVISETVGQYTGLDDKNGVKIFEGDIVLYEPFESHNNDRVIIYENGAFRGQLIRNRYSQILGDLDSLNVIGNIHDNPELLEEKK